MSDWHYERLSQQDNSFLVFEGPNCPYHVGAVQIFEAAPLRRPQGGIDIERIEEYVASRLHKIPRYRQRLARTPIERHPIWVDDTRFQLRYHVRHTRLPRPGDERLLKRTAGRIVSQHLDRGKPLWEMWVVEGLEGDRLAIVTKLHHCMVDGVAGVDLLNVLLTSAPVEKIEPPHAWMPRPAPSAAQLARDEAARALEAPLGAAGALWRLARDEDRAREELASRLGAIGRTLAGGASATPTSINQPVGPYRRIDWIETDLAHMRRVAKKLGGTVNDVVLATTAGAVRRFLKRFRQEDVRGIDFRVMAPVSMREAGERRLGNRVSAWILPLPVGERDPLERYELVRETTRQLKRTHAALAADTVLQLSEWTGTTLLSLGARLMETSVPFNLCVTNVPGPREPLYLLGARMLAAHPLIPLMGNLSTGIALMSYCDTLSWGLVGDWDLVPDLHDFTVSVERSYRRLAAAAGVD
ncbi:MAG: wax ester/triacylglycerol synthase family O-acyltransferase [Proteobacteria bacterium]|nr:MAG: wax ester/triacylglycerol synthase family O-acyltransferase [Pseudomonadota bacterium]